MSKKNIYKFEIIKPTQKDMNLYGVMAYVSKEDREYILKETGMGEAQKFIKFLERQIKCKK